MTAQTPTRYAEALKLFQGGRLTEAQTALEECVREAPQHVGAQFGLAVCVEKLGDSVRAEELYRSVLALDPRHLNAHVHLGQLLQRQGRLDEAVTLLRAATSIDPGSAAARRALESVLAAPQQAGASQPGESTRVLPTQGAPSSNGTGPVGVSTLAAALDSDAREQIPMAGSLVTTGHRRLMSHRRAWLGLVLLAVIPLLGLATRRLNDQVMDGNVSASTVSAVRAFDDFAVAAQYVLGVLAVAFLGAALISSWRTTYTVRERRIEIAKGVLFRNERSVWLYDINDIQFAQSPLLLLAGTGKLTLMVDESNASSKTAPTIIGFRGAGFMRQLGEELQPMVLRERRAMKKQFV